MASVKKKAWYLLHNVRVLLKKDFHCEKNKQDRQCTHNVTFRRFRATIIGVEKQ